MKKENFVSLVLGTVGGILFSLGMCMALVEEWAAFKQGVVVGAIGAVILIIMLFVRRKMAGRPAIKISAKTLGKIIWGVIGALVLGVGMSMIMVWNMMLWGIVVGIAGIVILLSLIPICMGLK